jgi:hypothetical protein
MLYGLEGKSGVAGVKFDLVLDLRLGVLSDDEQGETGESRRKEDEGEEELGAQAQIAALAPQEVCDGSAGGGLGVKLSKCHKEENLAGETGDVEWNEGTVATVLG